MSVIYPAHTHRAQTAEHTSGRVVSHAGGLLCALVMMVNAAMFLPAQSLWVDETTQLSGLTLGPMEVTGWLAGDDAGRFDVPRDRMPPMSYWVGQAWAGVFGLEVGAMRWLGVVLAGGAVWLTYAGAYRIGGLGAGLVAGLMLALSPNVVQEAVTIRAYPLFMALAAGGFYCQIRWLSSGGRAWLIGMVIAAIAAAYTHFFGVVLGGALLCGAMVGRFMQRQNLGSLLVASGASGVAMIGLIPFVSGAAAISGGYEEQAGGAAVWARDVARLGYRLVGHPAIAVSALASVAALLGAAVLALAGARHSFKQRCVPNLGVLSSLVVGGSAVAGAGLFVDGFATMSPRYNLWMLPGLAVLLGAGAGLARQGAGARSRPVIAGAAVMLLASHAYGSIQMIANASYFAHGPQKQIIALIDRLGPEDVAVVYEADAASIGQVAFPLRYTFGDRLEQYQRIGDTRSTAVEPFAASGRAEALSAVDRRYLLIVNVQAQRSGALRGHIRNGDQSLGASTTRELLGNVERWDERESHLWIAYTAAEVWLFERVDGRLP